MKNLQYNILGNYLLYFEFDIPFSATCCIELKLGETEHELALITVLVNGKKVDSEPYMKHIIPFLNQNNVKGY